MTKTFSTIYPILVMDKRIFAIMRLRFTGVPTPLFPAMVREGNVGTGEGPSDLDGTQHTSGDQDIETQTIPLLPDQEVQVSQPETSTPVADETSLGDPNVVLDRATTTHITSGGVEDRRKIAQTLSKLSDAPLLEGNTSRSAESREALKELMGFCLKLADKVEILGNKLTTTKQTHAQEITSLKARVADLER